MPWGWFSRSASNTTPEPPAASAAADSLSNEEARKIAASMPSHQHLFDQVKDGPCKLEVSRLIACNAKSGDCSKFFIMASRCTAKEAAPSQVDGSDDSAELDKETNGDVTLYGRIFQEEGERKPSLLGDTLQKMDVTGRVMNPDREEDESKLKEELKEAEGIGRIFDDSDNNRNQMGLLGTVLQTYFPRFFTPDDDDEDEDDDGDDDDDDVEDKGAGNAKNSEVQPAASQKPAVASDGASNAADKKKSA